MKDKKVHDDDRTTTTTPQAGRNGNAFVHITPRPSARPGVAPPIPFRFDRRASGLLMHLTSLPGRHGSGDLGNEAFAFADFLAGAGQRWWQMLPVGPPDGEGFSPYSAFSAFAGSPWLVSLDRLVEEGLLNADDAPKFSGDRVDFPRVHRYRNSRLRRAYDSFTARARHDDFQRFIHASAHWLDDYALFCALKRANRDKPWCDWHRNLRVRDRAAIRDAQRSLAHEIAFHQFVQYQFDRQWTALRRHCNDKGIGLIGDVPIFVGYDSCDVWARPELFQLKANGHPTVVSGCPPDDFNPDGQLWRHPHYDWSQHLRSNFAWWVSRFQLTMRQFDGVRIDHFLGMHRLWAVPATAKNARRGKWLSTPGKALLETIRKKIGEVPIIAEDLGAQTLEAEALLHQFGFPGMRIMQFAFGDGADYHRPHNYPRRCVAYSGTHDNDTILGWFRVARTPERRRALQYLSSSPKNLHWQMIRALMISPAETVIIPVQDLLGLGADARMNLPGTARGNWRWRVRPGLLNRSLARRLRNMTDLYGRT